MTWCANFRNRSIQDIKKSWIICNLKRMTWSRCLRQYQQLVLKDYFHSEQGRACAPGNPGSAEE